MFGHLWVSMQLWSGLFMHYPHPQCLVFQAHVFSQKHPKKKSKRNLRKMPETSPKFEENPPKMSHKQQISSIPRKSPNLTLSFPPRNSTCLFCCHVTVLGPKCPSILAILRLINSTLPMYMLARGTSRIPPKHDRPVTRVVFFFGEISWV